MPPPPHNVPSVSVDLSFAPGHLSRLATEGQRIHVLIECTVQPGIAGRQLAADEHEERKVERVPRAQRIVDQINAVAGELLWTRDERLASHWKEAHFVIVTFSF